ncbi:MAG: ATP-binding protein [Acidimicrobiia bacterium]
MTEACSRCGRENAPDHRFCGWCGAELASTEAASTAERRWVTVVFADLSGYTPASERMDPEDVRAMVEPGLIRCTAIVEEHGGWVNRIIGDAVLAVFGAPVAHEDDAERAVRAALAMQTCAGEHTGDFGGLRLRIGVNTGEVMFAPVGPDPARDLTVTGDVANTAARLQTAAEPGQVLVGAETWRATRATVDYESTASLALKGKVEPVAAWAAARALGGPGERPVSASPIIGREAELAILDTLWSRVADSAQPHLVTVLGPPGIGKSKLVGEVAQRVEHLGGRVARGTSLPYGERVPYAAFGALLKDLAGIYESDRVDIARTKLEAFTERTLPESDPEITEHLAILLGVGMIEQDVEQRKLFTAARRLVEALARDRPTVFVLEDIQWADRSLLDLLEWMPGRVKDAPALFLTAARPELLDTRPGWAGGLRGYTALPLGPLSAGQVRALATLLLANRADTEGVVDHMERVAGGNPLFIEELVSWSADREGADDFPTTVRAIIAARLDALPDVERRLLLDASVVGEVFWRGALMHVADGPADVDDRLDELEARDLVRREPTSRLQDDEEFSFKHLMIREVAYATVAKATRRERHRATAEYLESVGGGAGTSAAILARHWREAGEPERALEHLLVAADQAGRGWAKEEAVNLYNQALELVPEDDRARRKRIELRRGVARQLFLHAVIDAGQLGGPGTARAPD